MIDKTEVISVDNAQIVRMIRNEVREFMTQNTAYISPDDQIKWFDKHLRSGNKLYLYYNPKRAPVGYGYLRTTEDRRLWATLAVLPEFHNQGYGTEIYKHLIDVAGTVWIEIFANNNASMIAALKSGFEIEYMNDKVVVLKAVKSI